MAGFSVKTWVGLIVTSIVGLVIIAALFPTLTSALADYNTSEPTFGGVLQTVVPLLIGVAILLAFVYMYLERTD